MSIDIPEFPQTVGIPSLPTPGALTLTAGLAYESGYLTQATRETFDYDGGRSVGAADSEYGYTWENRAQLSAGDEGTTTADVETLTHVTGTDAWDASTQTALGRVKLYTATPGQVQVYWAHVGGGGSAKIGGAVIFQDGTKGRVYRVGVKNTDTLDWYEGKTPANSTAALGTGSQARGIWIGFIRRGVDLDAVYIDAAHTVDPTPAAATLITSVSAFFTSQLADCYAGRFAINAAGAATFDTTCKRVIDEGMVATPSSWMGAARPFAATQIETSIIQTGLYYNFGFENRKPTDAQLQQWLGDAENHQVWATAAPTYRLTWGTGGHAGSGSFAASGSAASSGTGTVLHLEITFTSDGTTRGSFDMRQPPPIAA